MNTDLIISLSDDLQGAWEWCCPGSVSSGARSGDRGVAVSEAEKSALNRPNTRHITVIISGQSVRALAHELPKMSKTERWSAANIFAEDLIASPIKDQHILLPDTGPDRLLIMSRERLRQSLESLNAVGLDPQTVYADFDCLPETEAPYGLADRIIYSGPLGYTLDFDANATSGLEPAQKQERLTLLSLYPHMTFDAALNLRQGEFARRLQFHMPTRHLRRVAMLIGALGLTYLILSVAQTRALTQHADSLRRATQVLYEDAVGSAAPNGNPVLAVNQRLKNRTQSDAVFLNLSQSLFDTIEGVNGITIDRLQYDNRQEQLTLRLVYPQFESAPTLERMAKDKGAILKTGSVRGENDRFIGEAVFTLEGTANRKIGS